MGYSYEIREEADFAKARTEDVNASYKDLSQVCYNIRRKPAEAAVKLLEEAKAMKRPIRYRSNNTGMGHRKELQGQKGRWPVKCVGIVLKCLKSAIANAGEKGLSEDLIVVHASANKKRSHMRYASKGRRNVSKLETARVEIVLREKLESKKERVAETTKKKAEAPAAPKAAPAEKELKPAPETAIKAEPKKAVEETQKAEKPKEAKPEPKKESAPKAEPKKAVAEAPKAGKAPEKKEVA